MRKIAAGLFWTTLLSVVLYAGVSVSPVITEMVLPPGSSYEGRLAITNTGDTPVIIEAQIKGFTAPGGTPLILDPAKDNYPYSGKDLLQITPTQAKLGPNEMTYFEYKVQMPENLDPYGGRYVAVVFKIKPAVSEAQVVTVAQVASLFLLNPGGDVSPHFSIKRIEANQDPNDPRRVIIRSVIANDGNLHINADQVCAMLHILDNDGYIIDQIPLRTHTMLPGTEYTHTTYWLAPEDLPSGTYQIHLSVILFGAIDKKAQHYFQQIATEFKF